MEESGWLEELGQMRSRVGEGIWVGEKIESAGGVGSG